MTEQQDLLELFAVPDIFVSGLGSVEDIGDGCFRFTMFITQDLHGRRERVVAAKIIMAAVALPEAMHKAGQMTGTCACLNARTMVRN